MSRTRVTESDAPLERDRELAAITALLEDAAAGRGGLVVLEGSAGIGKTRLLHAAVELARDRGADPLRAIGGELEGELAFGVVLQLFEPRLRRAARSERRELLAGAGALAAPLLEATARPPGARNEALSLFHGLFWITCNLADRGPLLIAVDDAQWADRMSLEFLIYLTQRLRELPVAMVLAHRDRELAPDRDVLVRLAGHPIARTLQPAALSELAVSSLVRERFPTCADEFVQACLQASGGNPFLLLELLRALEGQGIESTAAAAREIAVQAPGSILRFVLVRLARLPADATVLARAAAVLGEDASLRHTAALIKLDVDTAVTLVEALARAGILLASEPLEFVHPLLRSAVNADAPQLEREALHARAARLLADDGASAERVAMHLLRTRALADPWAVDRLCDAGRAAMARGASSSAVSFLGRALAEPPIAARSAAVLVDLADAESAAGCGDAPRHLSEAASVAAAPEERAQILLRLGRALYVRGELAAAAKAFDEGLTAAAGSAEVAAELQAGWLAVAYLLPELRPEARARTAALLDAPPEGVTHGERMLLAYIAERLVLDGEPRERARERALRALGNGALLASETPAGTTWLFANAVLIACEDYDSAERLLDEAMTDARRRGSLVGIANVSFARSWIDFQSGRLNDAMTDVEQVIEAGAYGWQHYLPSAHAVRAQILLERAEFDAADHALDDAAAPGVERTLLHALLLGTRGRLRLQQGHAREAFELLVEAGRIALSAEVIGPAAGPWRSQAALAAARLGDLERARALAAEDVELARRFGAPGRLGVALRAAALIEPGPARLPGLVDAVDALARSPLRLEHARALVDLGAAVRRDGRRLEARTPLGQGLDMAHRIGATLLERQAREELLASGARPRRTALRGVESLTSSEHRVAQMAAAGQTNREIAQALFVTLRTVEGHLSRAYDKLGIRSREQLPAALHDAGGVGPGL